MEFHTLYHKALRAVDQGDYRRAIALLEQGYTAQPDRLEWVWSLGAALVLGGAAEEGHALWFTAIAELDPVVMDDATTDLLRVLLELGERQHRAGYHRAASALYEAVLEIVGDSPGVHLILGHLQAERGHYDAAIAHWKTATQLDPSLAAAHQARAEVHQKLGEWDAAIAAYQAVLTIHPEEAIALHQIGLCYVHRGLSDQAIAAFKQALEQQPDSSAILGDLAYALLQAGNGNAALLTLQTLSRFGLGMLYKQGDPDLTLDRTRFANQMGTPEGLLPLGRLAIAAQDWPVAQTVAAAAIARLPDNTDAQALQTALLQQPILQRPTLQQPSQPCVGPSGAAAPYQAMVSAEAGVTRVPIHPPAVVTLRSPKTLDEAIHFSFRFDGAVALPESFVVTLPNGSVWLAPDHSSCAILTEDTVLLSDLSPEFPILSPGTPSPPHRLLAAPALTPPQAIDGSVAVLAGLSNDVYFHWLCDSVPRAALLQQSHIHWEAVDYVLVGDRLPFQRELLERLGIPRSKVLNLERYPHIQARQLIVPSFAGTAAWMSQPACEFVRQLIPIKREKTSDSPKRLYLSRQATTARRVLNGAEVETLLHRRGFVSLTLEGYSVQEQATLLANADVVVAPHGSGLTNLLFCQPETRVIELFSPNYVYPCYWYLANLVGLDYYYGIGQQPEGSSLRRLLYPNPRLEDIWVNLAELSALLDRANVT